MKATMRSVAVAVMLGSNYFTEIPAELLINPEVVYLISSNNPIESLPEKISGTVSAKHLVWITHC